jgi:hypothetical protein
MSVGDKPRRFGFTHVDPEAQNHLSESCLIPLLTFCRTSSNARHRPGISTASPTQARLHATLSPARVDHEWNKEVRG